MFNIMDKKKICLNRFNPLIDAEIKQYYQHIINMTQITIKRYINTYINLILDILMQWCINYQYYDLPQLYQLTHNQYVKYHHLLQTIDQHNIGIYIKKDAFRYGFMGICGKCQNKIIRKHPIIIIDQCCYYDLSSDINLTDWFPIEHHNKRCKIFTFQRLKFHNVYTMYKRAKPAVKQICLSSIKYDDVKLYEDLI